MAKGPRLGAGTGTASRAVAPFTVGETDTQVPAGPRPPSQESELAGPIPRMLPRYGLLGAWPDPSAGDTGSGCAQPALLSGVWQQPWGWGPGASVEFREASSAPGGQVGVFEAALSFPWVPELRPTQPPKGGPTSTLGTPRLV